MAKHAPQFRDARKPGWFYIDDAIIDHHGAAVGAIGVAVYAALARHVNAAGQTAIAYDRIADNLHISRNTVIGKLRTLAEHGLITIEPQTDENGNPIAANIYTLCVIPDKQHEPRRGGVPTVAPPVPMAAPPHATTASGGYQPVDGGVPTVAYEGHVPLHDLYESSSSDQPAHGTDDDDVIETTVSFLASIGVVNTAPFAQLDLAAVKARVKTLQRDPDWMPGGIVNSLKGNPPRPIRAQPKSAGPLIATKPNITDDALTPAERAARRSQSS